MGRAQILDAPFIESKELIGGFLLIDCSTRDEVLAIARDCPAVAWASIEMQETGTCHE